MCKCSHSLTCHFFLPLIVGWPLFCNGMRGNEPGSVCSLGGELVVGTYTNSMQGALSAGSSAHRMFRARGYVCLEGFGKGLCTGPSAAERGESEWAGERCGKR